MKKIVLLTAALIMTASMAFAGSSLISGTKHNLSSGGGQTTRSSTSDQICIYCHTPHNAQIAVPLWNRNNPAGTNFRLYTSSSTLTAAANAAAFATDSISLFCMSCHDGATTLGGSVVRNSSGQTLTVDTGNVAADVLTGTKAIGTDLTNDHPVAFSYDTAQSQDTAGLQLSTSGGAMAKIQFFKGQMECASCHKVHDNTVVPFLRTTMAGSTLCLACHIK